MTPEERVAEFAKICPLDHAQRDILTRIITAAAVIIGRDKEWTTEYPTKPGYYWIRNYLRRVDPQWQQHEEPRADPVMVAVNDDLTFQSAGSETERQRDEIISAEWCGPIEPPE